MPLLRVESRVFEFNILDRHIPDGFNSWENNWLEAEFAVGSVEHVVRFATRRLTVHDLYDLYFHLGIALENLSPTGVLIPMIQRQLLVKMCPDQEKFRTILEMPGLETVEFVVSREEVKCFAVEIGQLLRAYPLRADEYPSVAPVLEFYSSREKPGRLPSSSGWLGSIRSRLQVQNPLGKGRGDALRFTFTLSKPHASLDKEVLNGFFSARDYSVSWVGDTLRAQRGSTDTLLPLDNKHLSTHVEFCTVETHSIFTVDVWTAGVSQNSRKLFAWVGEAAMLEVLLAGNKSLDFVRERLACMDENMRRANRQDLLRLLFVAGGLAAITLVFM